MTNLQKLMKKAQQMQQDLQDAQGKLSEMEIEHIGNGVKVVVMGNYSVKSIEIDKELIEDVDDKECLEDCILLAVNGALDKVREASEKQMNGVAGGLNIPGLF